MSRHSKHWINCDCCKRTIAAVFTSTPSGIADAVQRKNGLMQRGNDICSKCLAKQPALGTENHA